MKYLLLVVIFCTFSFTQFAINLSAFSYHPDRKTADGFVFNEFNPGLGLRYTFMKNVHHLYSEIGLYKNSGYKWASSLNLGYQYQFIKNFFIGLNLAALKAENLNQGNWLFGPIPVISYKFYSVWINMVYFPKIPTVNKHSAFAWYFSIPID